MQTKIYTENAKITYTIFITIIDEKIDLFSFFRLFVYSLAEVRAKDSVDSRESRKPFDFSFESFNSTCCWCTCAWEAIIPTLSSRTCPSLTIMFKLLFFSLLLLLPELPLCLIDKPSELMLLLLIWLLTVLIWPLLLAGDEDDEVLPCWLEVDPVKFDGSTLGWITVNVWK